VSDALGRVITFGLDQFSSYHTQQLFLFRTRVRLLCQIQKRSGIVDLFTFAFMNSNRKTVPCSFLFPFRKTKLRLMKTWRQSTGTRAAACPPRGMANAILARACWSFAVKGFDDFSQARDALKKTVETTVERLTD
jgi:hypothetical protein